MEIESNKVLDPEIPRDTRLMMVQKKIKSAFVHAGKKPTEEKNILCSYVLWKLLKRMPREKVCEIGLDRVIKKDFEPDGSIRWPMEDLLNESFWADIRKIAACIDDDLVDDLVLCRYPGPTDATPEFVSALAAVLMGIQASDQVADLCCGTGSFMVAAHKKCPEAEIIGYDISRSRVDAARIRAKVAGERLSVVYGNVFALNPDDGKYFDKVFCHVPLGIRDNMGKHHFPSGPEFENVIAAEFPRFSGLPLGAWLFCIQAFRLTGPEGKAACLVPEAALRNIRYRKIRKYFITFGLMESVTMLPKGMLKPAADEAAIIVFSRGNKTVRMIDVGKIPAADVLKNGVISDALLRDTLTCQKDKVDIFRDLTIEDLSSRQYDLHPGKP